MSRRSSELLHHLVRAVILTGFAGLMFNLMVSGDMLLYIAPHLMIYAQLATAFLVIATGFQYYIAVASMKRKVVVCNCDHEHGHNHSHDSDHNDSSRSSWRSSAVYVVFIVPLLFGAFLPNDALAGSLAQKKGMNLGRAAMVGKPSSADFVEIDGDEDPALKEQFKTNVYNKDYAKLGMLLYKQDLIEMKDDWFIEKLQALNTFVNNFQGKQIRISGFVYREEGLTGTQFIIGRMAMTHCIADISPYGIIAESLDAEQYANDTWITVTGTIGQAIYHEQTVIKLNIESIEPASPAKIPYVYPDWNFAAKL
ncbi:TIGR03943 family putative permease subunit [Cohnella silvisoli]|uniref:TIGR03943 family protein n=1 Tax=Cohnella silvisoli TaxID=2873699 RepID=A0ABV1L6K7_9BACL|nr:TIGR03943 family protein [Cohnella silvisoli]MCD9026507.1 TIGR03943 family protein [Cohnella silvisoli]